MGLLDSIKSALGLGSNDEGDAEERTEVAVEYEPDVESEAAVKGTDASASTGSMTEEPSGAGAAEPAEAAGVESSGDGPDLDGSGGESGEFDEAVAAGTDASASTGSLTEEPPDEQEAAAEPAEATGPESQRGESSSDDGTPVTEISGIGPAYAERLEGAGITSVAELAAADPESVAAETDLSAKRVRRWVEQAGERSGHA